MNLASLLANVPVLDVRGPLDPFVQSVTRDSREVGRDDVFVAVRGGKVDGHGFVPGLRCAAVVVERDVTPVDGVTVVRVADSKRALALMCANLHNNPSHRVPVVGITGTNGKTTMSTLVDVALGSLGRVSARIGTTGNVFAGSPEPSAFTTPEAPQLQALLDDWLVRGARSVVMEVSSIGLAQHRVDGTRYHTAVFTNLTQDHLDFHGTMEAYRDAKSRLFTELLREPGGLPRAVVCADDPSWTTLGTPQDRWTYGFAPKADWHIEELGLSAGGMTVSVRTPQGRATLTSPLLGRHNAQNLVGAAAVLATLGIELGDIVDALGAVEGVAGRLERVADPAGRLVVVDYAHSPDALEHALRTVRELTPGALWVVFGCGGDRDAGKRPQMGAIAEALADRVVVTNDNPRSEDPAVIAASIVGGMRQPDAALVVLDRADAIRRAIASTGPTDAVLIAGKGHETTQEQAGTKSPFDDRQQARIALGEP